MSLERRQIMIVARDTAAAHPSFAKGGYIPLHPAATAYRNADFVTADPAEMLGWLQSRGCELIALQTEDRATRRYLVWLPDEQAYAAFKEAFGRSGQPSS